MTTKALQQWYNENEISYSEKQRLNTMGIADHSYQFLNGLKKMLECEEVAHRKSYDVSNISGDIHLILFFSTWFNNNCGLVIDKWNDKYYLRLVVHESGQGGMLERLWCSSYFDNPSSYLESLRDKAYDIQHKLKYGENPILEVHTGIISAFEHAYRGISLTELPTIISGTLPYSDSSSLKSLNPDHYFKPFDIMERGSSMGVSHSAIYLGNGYVAHVPGKGKGAIVDTWSGFLGDDSSSGSSSVSSRSGGGRVDRYHPIIPYKNQDGANGIKEHIARAVASDEYDTSYRLTGLWQGINRTHGNCQHFSNRCVLGLNFSEEGTKFKKKVPLGEEIGDTDREFRNLTIQSSNQGYYQNKKNQIENAVNSWRSNYQGQQFEAMIEVRPSPPCKIQ